MSANTEEDPHDTLNGGRGQRTSHAHVIKRQTAATSARQNVILNKSERQNSSSIYTSRVSAPTTFSAITV